MLDGLDPARRGDHARLDCAGLACVSGRRVASVRAVTDRVGTARELLVAR